MDSLARHALRLSFAGAGIALLGAGLAGPAFADEEPTGNPDGGTLSPLQTVPAPQDALDTENVRSFFVPNAEDIAALVANPLNTDS